VPGKGVFTTGFQAPPWKSQLPTLTTTSSAERAVHAARAVPVADTASRLRWKLPVAIGAGVDQVAPLSVLRR